MMWPWLLIILAAVAAALVWSSKHASHNADSLLPAVMSFQKVTWYYWGSDRFGNVLPFLASWINNIDLNFTFQVFLRAFMAMSIPALAFFYMNSSNFILQKYIAALAIIFITFSPTAVGSLWLDGQPYGSSVFFLMCGLGVNYLSCHRGARDIVLSFTSFVLVVCALFINVGLFILAFPLSFGAAVLDPTRRNLYFVAILFVAFAFNVYIANLVGGNYEGIYGTINVPTNDIYGTLLSNVYVALLRLDNQLYYSLIGLQIIIICVCLVTLQYFYSRSESRVGYIAPIVLRALVVLASVGFYISFVANLKWVELNGFNPRYFLLALAIIPSLAIELVVDASFAWRSQIVRRALPLATFATGLGLIVALATQVGSLDAQGPRIVEWSAKDISKLVSLIQRYNAAFIAGDYWKVWPTVFETIRVRQLAGERRPVMYGLSNRGKEMAPEIADHLRHACHEIVVCVEAEVASDCDRNISSFGIARRAQATKVIERGNLPSGAYFEVVNYSMETSNIDIFNRLKVTDAAVRDGSRLILDHVKNTVAVFGPYIQMYPGRYRLRYKIDGNLQIDPTSKLIKIQITNNAAKQVIYDHIFARRDLDNDWLSLDFTLPSSLPEKNAIEFRVWTMGETQIVLLALELKCLESRGGECCSRAGTSDNYP